MTGDAADRGRPDRAGPSTGFDRAEHMRRSVEDVWNHGDVAGFTAAFVEDAELQPDATYPGGGATITGRDAITAFFERIHRPVELGPMEEFADEQVLCRFRWTGSDAGYDWAFVYRFVGERIVRARYYQDAEQAVAAARDPAS